MKKYTFPYYISFGKLDSVSAEIEYSLSDKDARRLERSAQEGGRFRLSEDDNIGDIFSRVLKAIIKQEKEFLLLDPSPVADALSWADDYDPDAQITEKDIDKYIDDLNIGINYPKELQMLDCTIKRKPRQSKIKRIVIDRSLAQNNRSNSADRDKIELVDNGKTLYYVPFSFSGSFVIDSSVSKIERGAFESRSKITEVIIENGLSEIPEWTFENCKNLEHVVVPDSVKTIGFNAFTKCNKLKQVDLSEGLEEIHDTAFRFCEDLEELHVPVTVKRIGASIISYHNSLKEFYFEGVETLIEGVARNNWRNVTIHAKKGSQAEAFARKNKIKFVEI